MKKIKELFTELFSPEKHFFLMAKEGKRITYIAIAIPIVWVIISIGLLFSEIFLFEIVFQNPEVAPVFRTLYSLTVSVLFVMLFMWLWIRFFEKRSLKTIGLSSKNALKKYLLGFLTGVMMIFSVVGLMAIFGYLNFNSISLSVGYDTLGIVLLYLIAYIIQGANEEIISRGWQFQVIGVRSKPWIGAIISSISFALLHGFNAGVSIISIMNLLLFSFLLILFVLRDNSIWAACGWHTSWNWTMGNILGLNVSGSKEFGSLLNLTTKGPDFLSGGTFGPEGSIITTIVFIIGIILFFVLRGRKKQTTIIRQ